VGGALQGKADRFQYRIEILEYLIVPKTEHPEPLGSQPLGPLFVFLDPKHVLAAVQLDDYLALEANEVDDESPDGSLPAEFEAAKLLSAQPRPEPPLGIGHVFS